MKLTTAQKHYRTIITDFKNDKDAGFVANVIMTSCSKPATKLKNLVKLLLSGARVRTAQFDMFTIIVNDERVGGYEFFDKAAI